MHKLTYTYTYTYTDTFTYTLYCIGKLYVIPNCVANKVCMVQNSKGQYVATGVQATASIVQDKGGSNRHVVRSQ
ncbi:hypothetical protein EON63_02165 [archaeon]|nr:MAG: hypothetical protein EON63_02165 [archaeon]